jgi:hypothetical protein
LQIAKQTESAAQVNAAYLLHRPEYQYTDGTTGYRYPLKLTRQSTPGLVLDHRENPYNLNDFNIHPRRDAVHTPRVMEGTVRIQDKPLCIR